MPHESTVDPEEPMHFKSWGDEGPQADSLERRRSIQGQASNRNARLDHSLSIQTHPDLPLRVTHDHDDDGDPDEDNSSSADQDIQLDLRSRVVYTPPRRKMDQD